MPGSRCRRLTRRTRRTSRATTGRSAGGGTGVVRSGADVLAASPAAASPVAARQARMRAQPRSKEPPTYRPGTAQSAASCSSVSAVLGGACSCVAMLVLPAVSQRWPSRRRRWPPVRPRPGAGPGRGIPPRIVQEPPQARQSFGTGGRTTRTGRPEGRTREPPARGQPTQGSVGGRHRGATARGRSVRRQVCSAAGLCWVRRGRAVRRS